MSSKNTFDDSVEYLFKKNYLGNTKFNSAWEMSFIIRYSSVCNQIIKIKRSSKEDMISILDLGCSDKTFWRFWCKNLNAPGRPRIDYIGLEYRKDIVDQANKDKNYNTINKEEVLQFDLNTQSIKNVKKNKKYDVILIMEILEHLNEDRINIILNDVYDILSDRGFLVISSPNPKKKEGQEFVWPANHIKEYSLKEMEEIVSKKQFYTFNKNGWLGKARYIKANAEKKTLNLYNNLRSISSGFAADIIAYLYPELAECYTLMCNKKRWHE